MKLKVIIILLALGILLPFSVRAQTETLEMRLSKDWGFAAGGQIQGKFSLRVSGPAELARVDFLLDGEVVHSAAEAPFRFQFDTDDYPAGTHTLTAVGYKPDGSTVPGAEYVRQFLSPEESRAATMKILVPLLAVVGLISVVGVLGPVLIGRNQEFKPGQYGAAGGAVCPQCTFPYSRHYLSPNLLVGKLERCPHCGKWAIVARASQSNLTAAEERWRREGTSSVDAPSADEKLREMLDDSRFDN